MSRSLSLCWLLLLLVRATLVLCLADVFFHGEEFAKALGIKAVMDGVPLEYFAKNYGMHEGGGFVVAHLRGLFFALVGENLLAHKLAALVTSSALLLVLWRFVRTHLGERAALAAGLLLAVAPDSTLRFSLLCLGTHFEALICIVLILDQALRLGSPTASSARAAWGLGLSAGFGLYFSLQTLPASAAALLWVLYQRRARLQPQEWVGGLGGFVAGALPLWLALSQLGLAALRPVQTESAGSSVQDSITGVVHALATNDLFDWCAIALSVVGLCFGVRQFAALRLVALWGALFSLLYLVSGLALDYAYWFFYLRLAPLWLIGVLGMAALNELASRWQTPRRAAVLLALAAVFAGNLLDFARLLQDGRTGSLAANWNTLVHTKAFEYDFYFDKLFARVRGGDAHKWLVVRAFDEDPRLTWPAGASALATPARTLEELLPRLRSNLGEEYLLAVPGLGLALVPSYGHDLESAWSRIEAQPNELHAPLAQAAGRVALGLKFDEDKLRRALAVPVPAALRQDFLQGLGMRLYRLHRWRDDRAERFLQTLTPQDRDAVRAGWLAARETYRLP